MSGHRPWTEIRNAALDEPLQRQRRAELRSVNDLVQAVARQRAETAGAAVPHKPEGGA